MPATKAIAQTQERHGKVMLQARCRLLYLNCLGHSISLQTFLIPKASALECMGQTVANRTQLWDSMLQHKEDTETDNLGGYLYIYGFRGGPEMHAGTFGCHHIPLNLNVPDLQGTGQALRCKWSTQFPKLTDSGFGTGSPLRSETVLSCHTTSGPMGEQNRLLATQHTLLLTQTASGFPATSLADIVQILLR